jgi:hypothetical protein
VSELPPIDPGTVPPAAPRGEVLPWEDPNAGIGSLFPTAGQFITGPYQAYGKMSLTVDLVRPIAYFVIWVLFGALVGQFWQYLFWTPEAMNLIPKEFLDQAPVLGWMLEKPTPMKVAINLVVAPLLYLIMLFLWSAVVHVVLMLTGGAARGFGATLRVMCYSQTTSVAILVPMFGGIIQLVWVVVLQIMGLSQAQRITGGKAAVAVLLPIAVCCGCMVLLLGFGAYSAGSLLKH